MRALLELEHKLSAQASAGDPWDDDDVVKLLSMIRRQGMDDSIIDRQCEMEALIAEKLILESRIRMALSRYERSQVTAGRERLMDDISRWNDGLVVIAAKLREV